MLEDRNVFSQMSEAERADRLRESAVNREALTTLAATVARNLGLGAFWIDF